MADSRLSMDERIYVVRGQRVMLDSDLADIYGVLTKYLNQAVRRNLRRFPEEFMFRLSCEEAEILRLQIATSSWGGRRYLPLVFTEYGAVMLSSVLNSPRAVAASVSIAKAFVRQRRMIATHKRMLAKLNELENRVGEHDAEIRQIFDAIKQLMTPAAPEPRRVEGFRPDE